MKKIFRVALKDGTIRNVEGYKRMIAGVQCFIHKDLDGYGMYVISHLETGILITSSYIFKNAIRRAAEKITVQPEILEQGRRTVSLFTALPLNK